MSSHKDQEKNQCHLLNSFPYYNFVHTNTLADQEKTPRPLSEGLFQVFLDTMGLSNT